MQHAPQSAAQSLIDALKDPALSHAERGALLAALSDLHAPIAAPTAKARPLKAARVERKGDALRLTKTSVAAMALPAKGERYVYDIDVPQLAVRLRRGGRSYVFVAWDRSRKRAVKVTLGKADALTPEQARDKARELVGRSQAGDDLRRPASDGVTLAELIGKWHAEKSRSLRTADEMRDKALDFLGRLAHRPADEIDREDIGAIHSHIATKARRRVLKRVGDELRMVEVGKVGVPGTADKWLAIVGSVYGWGYGKGLVATNPCKGIGKAFNAKDNTRTNYLRGAELLRFWKALEADPDRDVRDALLLALYTGQRKGNVLRMRWADLDVRAGLWTLPASATKQKRVQSTPLSAQAREILAARRRDAAGPWVFPAVRGDGHMTESRPRDAWERICEAAGIEGLRIHDLRHTAGSWLARLGANTAVRQRALGHRTAAMAEKYAHLELDPVRDAMQGMSNAIQAAATKKPAKVRRLGSGK